MTNDEVYSADADRPPILSYLPLLRDYEKTQSRDPKSEATERKLNRYYFVSVIVPGIFSILVAVTGYFLELNDVKIAALLILLIAQVGVIGTPFLSVWYYRDSIKEFFQNPLSPLQKSAASTLAAFEHFIPILTNYSKAELDLAVASLKVERDALERRVGIVVGAIEKVGLIPSLIAAIVAIMKLSAEAGKSEWTDWYVGAAYVLLGLYGIAAFAHTHILRLDKTVRLLELAIAKKESYKFTFAKK